MGYRSLVIILLVLAAAFNLPQLRANPALKMTRSISLAVYFPVQVTVNALVNSNLDLVRYISRSYRVEIENDQLRDKLGQALARNQALEYDKTDNQSLRQALSFVNKNPYGLSLIPAEVIGRGGAQLDEEIIVNKGSAQGARVGQTVIGREGLVGRVIEVSKFSSKVLLITSPQSAVSAALKRSGTYGVAKGGQGRQLKLRYIPEETLIDTAEAVVVSPASSDYVRGILIGRVNKVNKSLDNLFCDVTVKPAVDLSRVDMVYLCKP
jgi:rod shape-determining protein MreC